MASIVRVGTRWRALVRRKGHRSYCKTLGTKAAAEAWARVVGGDIEAGRAPAPAAVLGRALLVRGLVHEYRALREQSRPISDASNEHYMLKRLAEGLGPLDALALAPQDLVGYCRARHAEGAGPYACNMEISKLGTVMRYAGVALRAPLPDVAGAARPLLQCACVHRGLSALRCSERPDNSTAPRGERCPGGRRSTPVCGRWP